MPNFPGLKLYPLNGTLGAVRDAGSITKSPQTGRARGGTQQDYNANMRGLGVRVDRKPKKPYP